jgi:hypothetical protein
MAWNCSRFLGTQIERVRFGQREPETLVPSTKNHLIGHCIKHAQLAKDVLPSVPSDCYHVAVNQRAAPAFLRETRISHNENGFLLRGDFVFDEPPNYVEIGPQEKSRVFPDGIRQIIERVLGDRTPDDRIEEIGDSGSHFWLWQDGCPGDVFRVGRESDLAHA